MMKGIEDAFEQQRLRIIEVLRKSTRLSRSIVEKEEIRKFLVENVNCIPDTISISEMDKLCNEVDWVKCTGRTILFLQGDYGNVYYIIACGQVGFYVAANKDLEMAIGRELGHLRTQPFIGTSDVLKTLGNNVLTLQVRLSCFSLQPLPSLIDLFMTIIMRLSTYIIARCWLWRVCYIICSKQDTKYSCCYSGR